MSTESESKKAKMDELSPRSRKLVESLNLSMGIRFNEISNKADITTKKLDEVITGLHW